MIHISCPSQFSQLPALFIHTHRLGEPVLKTGSPHPSPHPPKTLVEASYVGLSCQGQNPKVDSWLEGAACPGSCPGKITREVRTLSPAGTLDS